MTIIIGMACFLSLSLFKNLRYKMIRTALIILSLFALQGCFNNDPNRYELKSPCASADTGQITPCIRVPVNKSMG